MNVALSQGLLFALLAVVIWPNSPRPIPKPSHFTSRSLSAAGSSTKLGSKAVGRGVVMALFGACSGFLLIDFVGLIAGAAAGLLAWWLTNHDGRADRRVAAVLRAQSAPTFELLACALQAGQPLTRAVETVASISPTPTREILNRVVAHLRIGCSQREAWSQLRDTSGWEDVARDLAASAESGAGLAELLTAAAANARDEAAAHVQARARAVNVRSVLPMMCCFLPSFVLVGVVPIVAGVLSSGVLRP